MIIIIQPFEKQKNRQKDSPGFGGTFHLERADFPMRTAEQQE